MDVMNSAGNTLIAGARLVLRGWRVLVLAYVVSLLLGIAAGLPVAAGISGILNNNFEAQRLVNGFDFGTFIGLLMHPEFTMSTFVPGSLFISLLYFLFMLFLTGGLLADYRAEQRLTAGPFLSACGEFFWRFVRLLLFLALVLVPVGALYALLGWWTRKVAENAPGDRLGVLLQLGCLAFTLLLFLVIRLWFDVAQIRAVAENERKIRRALGKSFRMTFGNFGSLVWILFCIGIVALGGSAAALWVYVKVIRAEQIGLSILLGQVVVIFWLTIRLWLRACETVWYQRKFPPPVVFADAPIAPAPLEMEPMPESAITEPPSESVPPPVIPPDESAS